MRLVTFALAASLLSTACLDSEEGVDTTGDEFSASGLATTGSLNTAPCLITSGSTCTAHVAWSVDNYGACLFVKDALDAAAALKLVGCGYGLDGKSDPPWITSHPQTFELHAGSSPTSKLLSKIDVVGLNTPYPADSVADHRPRELDTAHGGGATRSAQGVATSWDGRLHVTIGEAADGSMGGWRVKMFRPEAIQVDPTTGYPNGATATALGEPLNGKETGNNFYVYSPTVLLDAVNPKTLEPNAPDACQFTNADLVNASKSAGHLHMAMFPHPSYTANPYKSANCGAGEDCETYEVLAIAHVHKTLDYTLSADYCPKTKAGFLARAWFEVNVANPRTKQATIKDVKFKQTFQALKTPAGHALIGEEPTVSLDGRLVIWQGQSGAVGTPHGNMLHYSFNENPLATTGWTEASSVSDMYYKEGPGAPKERVVAGVPFSERYPLAHAPLVTNDGQTYGPGQFFVGAYPWLSFDAHDLFFGLVSSFKGTARHGYSFIGQSTRWTVQNIDGGMNFTRGTSVDTVTAFDGSDLGDALIAAYRGLPTTWQPGVGQEPGALGGNFETALIAPVALFGSAWNPFADSNVGSKYFPFTPAKRAYGVVVGQRYLEVAADSVRDGHFIVNYPANESIRYNIDLAKQYANNQITADTLRMGDARFDAAHTPDISGNRLAGTLSNGANFPFEVFGAQRKDLNDVKAHGVEDIYVGVRGNSIMFKPGGRVDTKIPADVFGRIKTSGELTASLWVRTAAEPLDSSNMSLVRLASSANATLFQMSRKNGGDLAVAVGACSMPAGTLKQLLAPTGAFSLNAPKANAYRHVAATVSGRQLTVYVDGAQLFSKQCAAADVSPLFEVKGDVSMTVGPYVTTNAGSMYRLNLDEITLSDVARSADDIAELAFRKTRVGPAPTAAQMSEPASIANLAVRAPAGAVSDAVIALGEDIFNEKRLSSNGKVACATCHAGSSTTDGKAVAVGLATGSHNTPAITNRAFAANHMMDGRAPSLESQALLPIQNPKEMGMSFAAVLSFLKGDATLSSKFVSAFSLPNANAISMEHVARAIAAFERTLVSPANTPAVREMSLSASAAAGRALFFNKAQCATCHSGANLSDERFHNTGFAVGENDDPGLAGRTGRDADRGKFKTPSLRNIKGTGPYFHNGSATSLKSVVDFYNKGGNSATNRDADIHPLGLSATEEQNLVDFLNTL